MKKLVFCFDGTCNNPEDVSEYDEDISISNILKIHLLLGGKLTPFNGKNESIPNQHSFYYSGIGNRGNWLSRLINAAFAPKSGEMDDIIGEASSDLSQHYNAGDEIYIFGFSRGAAIARMFAAHLTMPVHFIGVFDTVAATRGSLDLNPETFPSSGIVFENDILAPHIAKAVHILALDEERLWLQPTLFNYDQRVQEVWFSGSHSDIGGGYRHDGLSDICLTHMLAYISTDLTLLTAKDLNYLALTIPDSTEKITFNDIHIQPKVSGKLHEQFRSYGHSFTHVTRSVRVNVDESPSNYLPIIHNSVEQRITQLSNYQPSALKGINYLVINDQLKLSDNKQLDLSTT